MDKNRLNHMRKCSILLPKPGDEVVRECLDEIERLTAELELWRDIGGPVRTATVQKAAIRKVKP